MPSFYNLQRRRQITGRLPRPRYNRPIPADYVAYLSRYLALNAEISAVIAALSASFNKPVYGKYKNWTKAQLRRKLSDLHRDYTEL